MRPLSLMAIPLALLFLACGCATEPLIDIDVGEGYEVEEPAPYGQGPPSALHSLSKKVERLEDKIEDLDEDLEDAEERIKELEKRLKSLEKHR